MFVRFAVVLAFVCWAADVSGQISTRPASDLSGWTPRQREIFQQTMSPNGHLTKEQHQEFWAPVRQKFGNPSQAEVAQLKAAIDAATTVGLVFQRETWSSVILSARAGKVVQSPGYLPARRRVQELAAKGLAPSNEINQAALNGDRVIEAAASRSPIQSAGRTMYVTEDLANQIIAGLDGMLARVTRLMNPVWSDAVTKNEVRYDDLGIALLTEEPFTRRNDNVQASGGTLQSATLTRVIDDLTAISVSVSNVSPTAFMASVDADLTNAVSGSLRAIGAKPIGGSSVQDFRGHRSIVAAGTLIMDGKHLSVSQRAFFRHKRRSLMLVTAIASHPIKADAVRESLELNLMLTSVD